VVQPKDCGVEKGYNSLGGMFQEEIEVVRWKVYWIWCHWPYLELCVVRP
jgi:hypothetical protein